MWEGLLDSAQMIAVKEVELDIVGQKAQSVSVSMKLAAACVQRLILRCELQFKRQFVVLYPSQHTLLISLRII